ncbi:hypothetical protein AMECASPLE_030066 [Ameca splendens]|uniref:Uncharacterized protein n=1 Tax=Ameca splendens TaxID=208324 RepID=A0ABV1AD59_9TELE
MYPCHKTLEPSPYHVDGLTNVLSSNEEMWVISQNQGHGLVLPKTHKKVVQSRGGKYIPNQTIQDGLKEYRRYIIGRARMEKQVRDGKCLICPFQVFVRPAVSSCGFL